MTGKEFLYGFESSPSADAPVVLSTRSLSRGGAFEDVTLDVHAGEILGITGRLGAGRTELALALFGLEPATGGEIRINDVPTEIRTNRQAIAGGIAYVPEDRIQLGLVMEQPIATNIVLTIVNSLTRMFGLVVPALRKGAADRWIGQLGIKVSDPENAVKTLSGGNQQRVVLGKWLATNPRILILDNPTVGVDINAKDGIYAITRRLAADGMAIILISDEVPEVLHHTHRILIMREGRISANLLASRTSESEIEAAIDG
jgi:simple sugar transport system ATP-binding protein